MKTIWIIFSVLISIAQLQSNNIDWSFPPGVLSALNQDASDPQVAIDGSGNVLAAWVENGIVKSSVHPVNQGWSVPITLSNPGASSPRIVSDLNGNSAAIWLENGIIKATYKPVIGSWSSPIPLSASGAKTPDLAVDSTGDVIAVWARKGNIEASTKLFGTNWNVHLTISSTKAISPKVSIGGTAPNEMAVVVWHGIENSTKVIYASTKFVAKPWSAQERLSDPAHNAINPDIAVDANDNAVAVWYTYDLNGPNYSNVIVQSAIKPFKQSWSLPTDLSASGIRNPANLIARVAVDRVGNAIALWNTSFDDETFSIQSAIHPVSRTWSEPVDLVDANLLAYEADLAVTSFGDVLAAYMLYNGESLMIQSVEADIDAAISHPWSVPIIFSEGDSNGYPRIAATLSNNVIQAATVWLSSNGSNNLVAAATGARTLILPPSNPTVVQHVNNFGLFNEYYNTVSWQASTDPNLAGYLIFRNGVVIDQVDANTLQITDHNRVQNAAATYGVAAIGAQASQSRTRHSQFPLRKQKNRTVKPSCYVAQ